MRRRLLIPLFIATLSADAVAQVRTASVPTLTPAQLAQLRTELETDPQGYGYAPLLALGADQTLADLLNHRRDGITTPPAGNIGPAITGIREEALAVADLLEAIDSRDFDVAAVAAHVAWFQSLVELRTVRLLDDAGQPTRVLGNLRRLILNPGTQGSRARLDALATRNGSRAEQLFGPRVVLTDDHVAAAFGR